MHTIYKSAYQPINRCIPFNLVAGLCCGMSQPKRITKRSTQVAVRLPQADYDALKARGPSVAGQVVAAVRAYLAGQAIAQAGPSVERRTLVERQGLG
jgi:hypothetical protein